MLKEKLLTANVLMAIAMIAVCITADFADFHRYVNEGCWCALVAIVNLMSVFKICNQSEEES